jgi:hypothetical protein
MIAGEFRWAMLVWALALPASALDFSLTLTLENLGTRETATREIAGVVVTYPVDEADVVEILETRIKAFMGRRSREAAGESAELVELCRDPEVAGGILQAVTRLLGGSPLSPAAEAALTEGFTEIESLAGQWSQWSGQVSQIRLWNRAQLADRAWDRGEAPGRFVFEHLAYDGKGNQIDFRFKLPFATRDVGQRWFDPMAPAVEGLQLDLPILVDPGSEAAAISEGLAQLLEALAGVLKKDATESLPRGMMRYLVEKTLAHEIEARLFRQSSPGVVANGLARIYLIPQLAATLPGGREQLTAGIAEIFSIPPPEEALAEARFFERWATLDPLGEVPPGMEQAASQLFAGVVFDLAQGEGSQPMPLQHLESFGIAVPEGGFDRAGFAAAMARAYPRWPEELAEIRELLGRQLRASMNREKAGKRPDVAKAAESPPAAYPESYQKLTVDGLTFRHPPAMAGAVGRIAPQWAADWRKAREILTQRFGGPWREGVSLTEADFEALRAYGVEPDRGEAVVFSLSVGMMANLDRWVVRLIAGNEVGIWFQDDLRAVLGERGAFGGVDFDMEGRSMTVGLPKFQYGQEVSADSKVSDLGKIVDATKPYVFPVMVEKNRVEGKPLDEQVEAIEKGDLYLRQLCLGAESIDPAEIAGGGFGGILTEAQSLFLIIHEVFESALIKTVIASPDRRWFCDGLANLVAIRECDRRFGAGEGLAAFEFLFDPEKCRAMAKEVNLLGWKAVEGESPNLAAVKGVAAAHYYFATLAMLEAIAGTDDDFIGQWIGEIRETTWNRVNAKTVMAAYQSLTDRPMEPILRGVVKPE